MWDSFFLLKDEVQSLLTRIIIVTILVRIIKILIYIIKYFMY